MSAGRHPSPAPPRPRTSAGRSRSMRAAAPSLVVLLLGFASCFPLVMLVSGSLMDPIGLSSVLGGVIAGEHGYAQPPLLPASPTAQSYVAVLVDTPAYHVLFWNSACIAAGVLVGQLIVATPAAWALARYEFRGKNALFFLYVLLMLLPFQVVMLPNYLVLNALGINNTLAAIILPGAFSAFPVFVMRHFFASIPNSVIESARLDGAGEVRIFLTIGIPLGAPGILAALVLGFFEYWSLVEQPLAFLKDQALWPLSLFQPTISFDNVGIVFASAAIAAVPAILVFLLGRDCLEQGIAATTRKERR